jgi:uncharacterized protein DUF1203
MHFRVSGLPAAPFLPFFALSDAELMARGARRVRHMPGSRRPCRVSLRYTPAEESALLLAYAHQPAAHSPYRASGPIFVREGAGAACELVDALPEVMSGASTLSLRAYDAGDMMIDAAVIAGAEARPAIERLLANESAAYLHVHFAPRGCYLARIDRA